MRRDIRKSRDARAANRASQAAFHTVLRTGRRRGIPIRRIPDRADPRIRPSRAGQVRTVLAGETRQGPLTAGPERRGRREGRGGEGGMRQGSTAARAFARAADAGACCPGPQGRASCGEDRGGSRGTAGRRSRDISDAASAPVRRIPHHAPRQGGGKRHALCPLRPRIRPCREGPGTPEGQALRRPLLQVAGRGGGGETRAPRRGREVATRAGRPLA